MSRTQTVSAASLQDTTRELSTLVLLSSLGASVLPTLVTAFLGPATSAAMKADVLSAATSLCQGPKWLQQQVDRIQQWTGLLAAMKADVLTVAVCQETQAYSIQGLETHAYKSWGLETQAYII